VAEDGHEGFIMYSLGNFVSNQSQLERRSTVILYLGLKRLADGEVVPYAARYVPVFVSRDFGAKGALAIDRIGGKTAERNHIIDILGSWGLAPAVTNPELAPHCDPGYVPPHPADGWIGGSCADGSDDVCGGTTCEPDAPGGLCTQECTSTCPDQVGRATTFCVDLEGIGGRCVLKCDTSADCREGYSCQTQSRPDGSASAKVCAPG
jgi:hypothetical protein